MNEITAKAALKYCIEEAVPFQLTYDGLGHFSIDLHSKIHANVLWGELRSLKPEAEKEIHMLERPFFYRVH